LASRTQQSTEEIKQIIANLQTGAKDAVYAIQQGEQQSEASVEKVLEAEANIQKVSGAIDQITQINTQIAAAIADQSKLGDSIRAQLDGLNAIAQSNGEHADSCANDNQKLAQLSVRMGDAIDKLQGTQH
jgi:methyl-accepting chemotaxis protein